MIDYGFIRTAAAVPVVKVSQTRFNTSEICRIISEAFDKNVSLIVFPELSITGCTCGDLFHHKSLLKGAEEGVRQIIEHSRGKASAIVVGAPIEHNGHLYNCAIVVKNGNIKGIVPKINVEKNSPFSSGTDFLNGKPVHTELIDNGKDTYREGFCSIIHYAGQRCNISPEILFEFGNSTFGVEIGEDTYLPVSPSSYFCPAGAAIVARPSAEKADILGNKRIKTLIEAKSRTTFSAYICASSGFGESTQDNTYAGDSFIYENGCLLNQNERWSNNSSLIISDVDIEYLRTSRHLTDTFKIYNPCEKAVETIYSRIPLGNTCKTDFEEELYRFVEPHPFTPREGLEKRCEEALAIQTTALATRLSHINCQKVVIGISGGLDSTLALLVAVNAFDKCGLSRKGIIGITMPGFGTTSRTKGNADHLMEILGITAEEISITAACTQHFKDIGQDPAVLDAAYENSQARERTQILMDYANRVNAIVVGTGDLSELALGWATYNGDHMSMYGVNGGVPKTLVKELVKWCSENMFPQAKEILLDIVGTPISPELIPAKEDDSIAQVTEDLVGPYELHDFFIYNFVRRCYSAEKIFFLAKKAFKDYDDKTIRKWLDTFIRRFFRQQFKRSCMPDGPRIGSVNLSPRGAWSMPSDIEVSSDPESDIWF